MGGKGHGGKGHEGHKHRGHKHHGHKHHGHKHHGHKHREPHGPGDEGHEDHGRDEHGRDEHGREEHGRGERGRHEGRDRSGDGRRPDDGPPSLAAWAREGGERPAQGPRGPDVPAAPGAVLARGEAPVHLAAIDPDSTGRFGSKAEAADELDHHRERIREWQERFYAEHKRSLLVVLQAIDTGGKDGTIRHVFEGVNPQGCHVWSFKAPTSEELDHDFLWRYHARTPGRGMIAIFNRSHYEDVLIARVKNLVPPDVWEARYGVINDFERLLALSGTTVLKFFLHISRDEQKRRLESRLEDPAKHWKFDRADLVERESWDAYQEAFEAAINRCGTPHAPWYVVPANRKWFRNLVVARTIADTLEALDPQYPPAQEGLEGVRVPS